MSGQAQSVASLQSLLKDVFQTQLCLRRRPSKLTLPPLLSRSAQASQALCTARHATWQAVRVQVRTLPARCSSCCPSRSASLVQLPVLTLSITDPRCSTTCESGAGCSTAAPLLCRPLVLLLQNPPRRGVDGVASGTRGVPSAASPPWVEVGRALGAPGAPASACPPAAIAALLALGSPCRVLHKQ